MRRACWALAATLSLTGCLSDPELLECHDFPLGTEGCPEEPCDVYCGLMTEACPDVYGSEALCQNDCANEPVTDFVNGDFGDTQGNSLSCRITYAKQGQCAEAGLLETTQCQGLAFDCEDYCALMDEGNCSGAYPTVANCLDACAVLPRGSAADVNTIDCRFRYAQMAQSDAQFCDAAALAGGGVCGSQCDVYCDLVADNCTGEFSLYSDAATCQAACGFLSAGSFDDWQFSIEADTVECRTYHVGPPADLDPATHCPHARIYNDAHCGIAPGVDPQPEDWPCVAYCNIVLNNCPGVYSGIAECRTDCAMFDEVRNPDPMLGPQLFPVTSTVCPVP